MYTKINTLLILTCFYLFACKPINNKHHVDNVVEKILQDTSYLSLATDSIRQKCLSEKSDSLYYMYSNDWAIELIKIGNYTDGLTLITKIKQEAKKNKSVFGESYANYMLGNYYLNKSLWDSAYYFFQLGLKKCNPQYHSNLKTQLFYALGETNRMQSKVENALKYYNLALELAITINNKTLQSRCYRSLAEVYKWKKNDIKAFVYCQKAIDNAIDMKDNLLIGICYLLKGTLIKNNPQQELNYYIKAISPLKKANDFRFLTETYIQIGYIYAHRYAKNDLALKYYSTAYYTASSIKHTRYKSTACLALAELYTKQKEYKKANQYLKECLDINTIINDSFIAIESYLMISDIYLLQNDFVNSINMISKVIAIATKNNDDLGIAQAYYQAGKIYQKNAIDTAISCYLKAIKYSELADNIDLKISSLLNISKSYIQINKYKEAHKVALEAYQITPYGSGHIHKEASLEQLRTIFFLMHDYKKAYIYYEKLNKLKESLNKEETTKRFLLQEAQQKENILRSSLLNKQHQKDILYEQHLRQKNHYIFITLLLFTLAIGCSVIIYMNKQKQQALLIKDKVLVEQRLLRTQMNPHFIFNALSSIQEYIYNNDKQQAADYLVSFAALIRLVLESSKSEYITLKKDVETLTYFFSMQQLLLANTFTYTINIEPSIDDENVCVPPMLMQPFVENALKHGIKNRSNGEVIVNIKLNDINNLSFEIIDNGAGIKNTVKTKNTSHQSMALNITKERLKFIQKNTFTLEISDVNPSDNKYPGTFIKFGVPYITKW